MSALVIGWSDQPDERAARGALIRAAWHAAYAHIFSAAEIDDIFDGRLEGRGSWVAARLAPAGTLAGRREGVIVGLASLGLLLGGSGELAAFYVLPEEQGQGVGSALWHAAAAELRARNCAAMEVWTLSRSAARHYYQARGCTEIGTGTFTVANHVEPAVGYALDLARVDPSTLSTPTR